VGVPSPGDARYADDLVVLCRSEAEAQRALDLLGQRVRGRGLSLHPGKTRLVDITIAHEGFDFLGYHFEGDRRWPRRKSLRKVKDALRSKTPRGMATAWRPLSKMSIGPFAAGLSILSIAGNGPFLPWISGYAGAFGVSCAGGRIERESVEDLIISAGLTHSFGRMGFSALQMPIELYSSPLGGKTTDRRAGCGRSASPVRREGRSKPMRRPYPYHGC